MRLSYNAFLTYAKLHLVPPGESKEKGAAFEKIFLPECHTDDFESYFVLFPVRPIKFSNLPSFDRPFLPVEMGYVLQKALFEDVQKGVKTPSKISLCSPS